MDEKRELSSIVMYQTEDGRTKLEVRLEDETVWLTQKLMAELFQKDIRTISEHLHNIFEEHELVADSVIRNFRTTAADGKAYTTQYYSLDVIISVGYNLRLNTQKKNMMSFIRNWLLSRIRLRVLLTRR